MHMVPSIILIIHSLGGTQIKSVDWENLKKLVHFSKKKKTIFFTRHWHWDRLNVHAWYFLRYCHSMIFLFFAIIFWKIKNLLEFFILWTILLQFCAMFLNFPSDKCKLCSQPLCFVSSDFSREGGEIYLSFSDGSWRISDFSLTNSFATSSLLRCQRILRIVQPVSSFGMLLNSGNHRAQDR